MNDDDRADAPALQLENLTKVYPKRQPGETEQALAGIDLTVRRGEAVVLAGANGAGKSTALRIAAGIEEPTRGTAKVFGLSPRAMASRRRIGYLPDSSELFDFLDWRETLAFFSAAANLPRGEGRRRAEKLGERLGLTSFGKKRAKAFSMGMRRRLGLAAVLISEPALLLLDEPISGLDPEAQRLFLDVMRDEKERGAALVLSSHHLGSIQQFCDRLYVLRQGRVVLGGPLDEIGAAIGSRDLVAADADETRLAQLRDYAASIGVKLGPARISEAGLEDWMLGLERADEPT